VIDPPSAPLPSRQPVLRAISRSFRRGTLSRGQPSTGRGATSSACRDRQRSSGDGDVSSGRCLTRQDRFQAYLQNDHTTDGRSIATKGTRAYGRVASQAGRGLDAALVLTLELTDLSSGAARCTPLGPIKSNERRRGKNPGRRSSVAPQSVPASEPSSTVVKVQRSAPSAPLGGPRWLTHRLVIRCRSAQGFPECPVHQAAHRRGTHGLRCAGGVGDGGSNE